MQSSFLVNNVQNLMRNLRQEPISAMPRLLASMAKPKLKRLSEELAHRTSLGALAGRAYRGKGIAVMFHEIQADIDAELRTGCDAAQLERIVIALRSQGRDIVTVEEGLRRLADPHSTPFALITFDDGYRDNLTVALPVLDRLKAPMTIFIPTGMMTRGIYAWWLGLRTWIKNSDTIDFEPMGHRFTCADLASKVSAMRRITAWIGADQSRAGALAPYFAAWDIDLPSVVDRYAMNETELQGMATNPLVEIGAHTETHRFLSGLQEDEALAEFRGNKAYLESLLERPVSYLAYPYGSPAACGEREARLAEAAGFRASFTTRHGHLFAEHLNHRQLLPRIDVGYAPQSAAALASRLNGLDRAMSTGFGNPVAVLT